MKVIPSEAVSESDTVCVAEGSHLRVWVGTEVSVWVSLAVRVSVGAALEVALGMRDAVAGGSRVRVAVKPSTEMVSVEVRDGISLNVALPLGRADSVKVSVPVSILVPVRLLVFVEVYSVADMVAFGVAKRDRVWVRVGPSMLVCVRDSPSEPDQVSEMETDRVS